MAVVLALATSGCGSISIPLSGKPKADDLTTATTGPDAGRAALPKPLAYETLGDSDWEVVRRTLTGSVGLAKSEKVEWKNAQTGSQGAITDLQAYRAANGADCRSFATTISRIDGVKLYRAQACEGRQGWDIVDVRAVGG